MSSDSETVVTASPSLSPVSTPPPKKKRKHAEREPPSEVDETPPSSPVAKSPSPPPKKKQTKKIAAGSAFTSEENAFIIHHKETLSENWAQIEKAHAAKFGGRARTAGGMQKHYSTKLKGSAVVLSPQQVSLRFVLVFSVLLLMCACRSRGSAKREKMSAGENFGSMSTSATRCCLEEMISEKLCVQRSVMKLMQRIRRLRWMAADLQAGFRRNGKHLIEFETKTI